MAINKDNILTHNLSGRIAKQLIFKKYGDKTVVSKFPDMSKVVQSENQLLTCSRFQKAVAYAKSIINDPEKKAAYQANLKKGKTVYLAAIAEFMSKG